MTEAGSTATAENVIISTLSSLLQRRGADLHEITPESKLAADLQLDSLELAELSAALEDDLGSDPYSMGLTPETVGEIIAFYD
jgi:acyl carrier protein